MSVIACKHEDLPVIKDVASTDSVSVKPGDTGARINNADDEPQNWLATGRNFEETRFSPLKRITKKTVSRLGLQWSYDLDTDKGQEATSLVVDGVLYTTSAWSKLHAFNAVTGELLWQYDPEVPKKTLVNACCDAVNRGAAYWDGKVYVASLDGRLIAVDAKTGKAVWETLTVDPTMPYTITGAPRAAEGLIFIGNGGGEFGVRGYISAYDATSGEKRWRFYTVPGEPGKKDGEVSDNIHEQLSLDTWSGRWWDKAGGFGGGTVWDSMAYDAEAGLLYFGVGNGSYWNKKYRSGEDNDNLFVASVVAVKASSGEYVWHYQHTPGDAWDYTSTQHMILATLSIDNIDRKVLMQAPKNGFFYVIDRLTGKLITAENYVPVNWAEGIDLKTGRPNIKPQAYYWKTNETWVAFPSPFGGHNWHPMSYSPQSGLVYIPTQEIPGVYRPDNAFKPEPIGLNLALDMRVLALPDDPQAFNAIKNSLKGYLLAWDPVAQKEVWRAPHRGPWNGGVLSTAGDLVFQGDVDGVFNAYNAKTGELLWQFDTGNMISAAPMTYSVGGRQYITVLSGFGTAWSKLAGKLAWDDIGPGQNKSRVLTFALDGKKTLPLMQRELPTLTMMPEQFGTQAMIDEGEKLYHHTCFGCHGAGAVAESLSPPDLRYSGLVHVAAAWKSVVLDGVLSDRGMVGFKENFTDSEAEAIRAYVIARARQSLGK
ncbi:MAG: PQQ-dependent dehydrogenase, methanol/ethanol family [Spongiibacteraceae bacterium]|nr:PQQ-dependent dehydrogenase, methanol/ethanol family [Spongiibacteraceae bacterium]